MENDKGMAKTSQPLQRCPWAGNDALYVAYHDEEWGVPEHDPERLFEKLILDGFQAGLSWIIILRKRDAFRQAFDGFDPAKIARYGPKRVEALMGNAGIVRNRAKIEAAVLSAQAYLAMGECGESFSDYLWQFTDGKTLQHKARSMDQIPTQNPQSLAMSKDLKKRGFKFCGPTICYAFMQAVGMVNDHLTQCFRQRQVSS